MQGKRIKWGNVIILLLIIAAGIAAFYYKNPGTFRDIINRAEGKSDTAPGNTAGKDEFVVGLDSWIGGTPALIALSREYNKDYSLDMKLEYITNDEERIHKLIDGGIDATEMSLPAFVRFLDRYPDAGTIVGITDFSRGADGIVAKSEVKDLNDMEGRKVSYVGDGTGKFILNKFLRLTGLRYQDITPVERKEMSEVVDDLKTGRADLIVSWSPDMNLAIKDINTSKPGSVKLLISTREVPELVPTVLVVNRGTLGKQPEQVTAFLKTWYASAKYIIEKNDRAVEKLVQLMAENSEIYGNATGQEVKDSFSNIRLMSLGDNFAYFGLEGNQKSLSSIINDTAETWLKYGDTKGSGIKQDAVDGSFMKKLMAENDAEILVAGTAGDGGPAQTAPEDKEFQKQDDVSIEKNTEKVARIDVPPVYYDTGASTVRSDSLPVLNEIVSVLKQFPEYYLIIDANTDSVGSEDFNLMLSKDRANEVKTRLAAQGINPDRLVARGWGEYRPVVADEKTDEDRAKNRRTEFTLTRDVAGK